MSSASIISLSSQPESLDESLFFQNKSFLTFTWPFMGGGGITEISILCLKEEKEENIKSHPNTGAKVIFPQSVNILNYIEAFQIKCELLNYEVYMNYMHITCKMIITLE